MRMRMGYIERIGDLNLLETAVLLRNAFMTAGSILMASFFSVTIF